MLVLVLILMHCADVGCSCVVVLGYQAAGLLVRDLLVP